MVKEGGIQVLVCQSYGNSGPNTDGDRSHKTAVIRIRQIRVSDTDIWGFYVTNCSNKVNST